MLWWDYKKREVSAILVVWTAMGEKEGAGGGGVVQVCCEYMNLDKSVNGIHD